MPSTSIGVYPGSTSAVENDQVSSTYEGRHLTFYANDISAGEHTLITKGHPVVIGEHIVGVALATEIAAANNLIPIDTEGIWNLMVYPKDDLGAIDVVAGDELWINKLTSEISKMRNAVTHTRFGYALGGVTTVVGNEVIAVKVHWDGDDEIEQIGLTGAPFVSDEADRKFRQYYYDAGGGGIIEGERMELNITAPAVTACVDYRRLLLAACATPIITGRSSVIEARVDIEDGAGMCRTCAVMVLDWNCNHVLQPNTSWSNSYIMLRDRHEEDYSGLAISALFHFYDHDALDDGGVNLGWGVLQDSSTDHASDVRIACTRGAGNHRFWILATTTAPD